VKLHTPAGVFRRARLAPRVKDAASLGVARLRLGNYDDTRPAPGPQFTCARPPGTSVAKPIPALAPPGVVFSLPSKAKVLRTPPVKDGARSLRRCREKSTASARKHRPPSGGRLPANPVRDEFGVRFSAFSLHFADEAACRWHAGSLRQRFVGGLPALSSSSCFPGKSGAIQPPSVKNIRTEISAEESPLLRPAGRLKPVNRNLAGTIEQRQPRSRLKKFRAWVGVQVKVGRFGPLTPGIP